MNIVELEYAPIGPPRPALFTDNLRLPTFARLSDNRGPTTAALQARPTSKILVVDDSPFLQELLAITFSELLGRCKARLLWASNGKMGLRLANEERPAIILFDLNMPLLNGLEMVAQLHQSHAWAEGYRPRLIALSSQSDARTLAQATALGVEHFYTKPFDPTTLLDRVRSMVEEGN